MGTTELKMSAVLIIIYLKILGQNNITESIAE